MSHLDESPCRFFPHKARERWEQRWENIDPMNNKLRKIKNDTRDWNLSFPRGRKYEVALCRLRIGHTRLTHSHLMESRPPSDCPQCDDTPFTVEHILCECPHYNQLRTSCFRSQNPTIQSILGRKSSVRISKPSTLP